MGAVVRESEEIGARLGGGVWGAGIERSGLGERSLFSERSVDFIGRDVEKTTRIVATCGFEEDVSAEDVCPNEGFGVFDATVDMALGGEVDDRIKGRAS